MWSSLLILVGVSTMMSVSRLFHFCSLLGVWMASVLLLQLSESSWVVAATIQSPPDMIREPPLDLLLFHVSRMNEAEKPFILPCEASGNPEPTYAWTKNGQPFLFRSYDGRIVQQTGRGTLVFYKPQSEDEGHYQCLATNEHGTSLSNVAFVRESDLASFPDEAPKNVTVKEGEPLTLTCSPPTGFPKPKLFWVVQSRSGALRRINDSRITVDPEGHLHFSNVTMADASDESYYACCALQIFRSKYKLGTKVSLTVLPSGGSIIQANHPPKAQYRSPPNIEAVLGKTQEIHCIFGGTPLPKIRWVANPIQGILCEIGKKYPDQSRYDIVNYGRTLRLKNMDFCDQGMYECKARNGVGSAQSWAVFILVHPAPYWIKAPNNTVAAEGETVRFECLPDGHRQPTITWLVNGVDISRVPFNPRRKVNDYVMVIEGLTKQDTAVYQCNATNKHGYAFREFYLNVLDVEPEITEPPEPLYETVEVVDVIMRCRVFGAPKPEVKWMKGETTLTGGRFRVLDEGDLLIRGTWFTDSGRYKCIARNKLNVTQSSDELGLLKVMERTVITAEPEDYEVVAGHSATFRCSARKDSNLELEIEWMAKEQVIDFDGDPRMYKGADWSLTISNTTELDSGLYTCVAKTRLDKAAASATLIVQNRPNPPRLVGVNCKQKTASVEWLPMGDNRAPILHFIIQYNTSFSPDVWEDAFDNVPASDLKFDVSLNPWANYSFRVIARNKIGNSLPSSHSEQCATLPDVPYNNPENVKGEGTAPNNLVISWKRMPPIEHNGPGFFYQVYWKRTTIDMDWQIAKVPNWEQARLRIDNQPTFEPYLIKVEAHNSRGQANVAAVEVVGYSGEDVPLMAPGNLTAMIRGPNRALLRWAPVPLASVRGHFKGYKIQTWTLEEMHDEITFMRQVMVLANSTEAEVTIFIPFVQNFVHVLAYNNWYNGPPSQRLSFVMPEGTPGPVKSLDAVAMGSSTLRLSWEKPLDPNGNLTGYRIYYEKVEGTKIRSKIERDPPITDPDINTVELVGLEAGTKYRLTVCASTAAGIGDPYFIEVTTKESDLVGTNLATDVDSGSTECRNLNVRCWLSALMAVFSSL